MSARSFQQPTTYNLQPNRGFTLVELLVAITILATLIGGVLLAINPMAQVNKAQDAKRLSDIQQVKTALELYYSDNNKYPTTIPFGYEWKVQDSMGKETIYMKKVPQDPNCNNDNNNCYKYRTDTTVGAKPQWAVIFAQLSKSTAYANTCPLSTLSNACTPDGYTNGVWACTVLGAVDCGLLASVSLGHGVETVVPPPVGSIEALPPLPAGSYKYSLGNPVSANPYAKSATIMPLYPVSGMQSIRVEVDDSVADVTGVKVDLYADKLYISREFTLKLIAGTVRSGTWGGVWWDVNDTYYNNYVYSIVATDKNGKQISTLRIKP